MKQYFFNLLEVIEPIIQVLVYGGYLFLLDYRMVIVIILTCCLTVKIPQTTGPELSRRKKAHQKAMGNYMKVVNDLFLEFKNVVVNYGEFKVGPINLKFEKGKNML